MNLWVKRTGQLLVAVLFLMSCEDDSFLLGFKNQNKKFNAHYQEFLLGESSVIALNPVGDSITTDNFTGTQRLLVGEYTDPIVGSVRTEAFAEFLPASPLPLAAFPAYGYEFDSIVFQMQLDYYSYGLTNEVVSKFNVHRITGDTLYYVKPVITSTDTTYAYNRYYANSTVGYDGLDTLGVARLFTLSRVNETNKYYPTTLKLSKLAEAKDTLVIRTRLSDDFGLDIFNTALNNVNSEFSNYGIFTSNFKGLALIPSVGNAVVGFSPGAPYSKVTLHYHSTENGITKDTLYRDFHFRGTSFHNITPTRSGDFPAPPMDDESHVVTTPVSGVRVIQNGNPLATKIDLAPFYTQFADTINENIEINSAQLVIESVASDDGFSAIPNLELSLMDENGNFINYADDAIRDSLTGFFLISNAKHYFVGRDLSSSSLIAAYSSTKDRYAATMTLFMQSLFDYKDDLKKMRPRYLGLTPFDMGKTINRSVFNQSNVKLRIYYTYPNRPNL